MSQEKFDRRKFVGLMSSVVAATASARAAEAATAPEPKDGRPNFLFMIADDLNYRTINALTNKEVHTPNLDRLAARGCAFTHCFHQGSWMPAVCVASRTMLNSGLTTFRAQKYTDHVAHWLPNNIDDSVQTWGETMGRNGYDTSIFGKWHLDAPLLSRSFERTYVVAPGMFPSTSVRGDAYNRPSPGNKWEPTDKTQYGHWLKTKFWERDGKQKEVIKHSTEVYADHAIDYLTNVAPKSSKPFFAYIGWNAPHDPRQSPEEFLAMYPQDKIEIPPNYLPEHPFDEGEHKIRDEILAPFPRTHEAVQLHRKEYYSIITHLDHHIGRVLDALDASGKADNTYIIMTADHGLAMGEHGLMGKQNVYEASCRMPLLIAGPRITAGKRVDELVYQHSMFATTCDLAGIEKPEQVEFPSLKQMLHEATPKPQRDAVFCCYRHFQRSARTKTHKLIVYPMAKQTQLFDLVNDPWEMHNLADDPGSSKLKADMFNHLRKLQHELGDYLDLDNPGPAIIEDAEFHD